MMGNHNIIHSKHCTTLYRIPMFPLSCAAAQ
jgi:hypothetical protein